MTRFVVEFFSAKPLLAGKDVLIHPRTRRGFQGNLDKFFIHPDAVRSV